VTAVVRAWARERVVDALCIDHGHVDRPGSQACRTCNRRADAVLAVLPELLTDERVVQAAERAIRATPDEPWPYPAEVLAAAAEALAGAS
jgi:hypothetical protein